MDDQQLSLNARQVSIVRGLWDNFVDDREHYRILANSVPDGTEQEVIDLALLLGVQPGSILTEAAGEA